MELKSLAALKRIAVGEADRTANQRLPNGSWLRVVADNASGGTNRFTYFHDKGRKRTPITELVAIDILYSEADGRG